MVLISTYIFLKLYGTNSDFHIHGMHKILQRIMKLVRRVRKFHFLVTKNITLSTKVLNDCF
jgi:hypothetical protein